MCSPSFQPIPSPSTKRPPLSTSSCAASRPTFEGGRNITGVTSDPKRMRSVSRAASANSRYGSSESIWLTV